MREHQIVITLKPEQFLAIQKLARGANAKSMGAFVRQQLLAALGLEGSAQSAKNELADRDLEPVVTELRRLHGELKGFVAESLSLYVVNEPVAEMPEQAVVNPYIDDQYQITKEPSVEPIDDQLEQVADRMFAISPRLGAIEPEEPFRDPLAELLGDEDLTAQGQRPLAQDDQRETDEEDDEDEEDEEDYLLSNARAVAQARAQAKLAEQLAVEEGPEPERWPTREEVEQKRVAQIAAEQAAAQEDEAELEPLSEQDEENINAAYRQAPQDTSSYGNSHGGSPFSGGPPPKRRKL